MHRLGDCQMSAEEGNLDLDKWWKGDGVQRTDPRFLFLIILFPGNIILLKEKGGMRESVPRQVDKESRGPQGERGLEFSRRKKGQTFFLSPHSLGLSKNNVSCLTVFGLNLLLS